MVRRGRWGWGVRMGGPLSCSYCSSLGEQAERGSCGWADDRVPEGSQGTIGAIKDKSAKGKRVARRPLIASASVAAVLALVASLLTLTPWGRGAWQSATSRLGWGTSEEGWERTPQDAVYYTDVDDTGGLTEDQVRQIAYDVCPQALDEGDCLDYTVEITDLDGAFGLVEVSWERPDAGVPEEDVPLATSGVMLDRALTEKPAQYVANVAAHEWNHVEQAHILETLAGRNALKERAFNYYDARVPGGLGRESLGIEILTDCMATEGDNVPAGVGDSVVPYYVKTYMGATDTAEACGDWEAVLRGPVE